MTFFLFKKLMQIHISFFRFIIFFPITIIFIIIIIIFSPFFLIRIGRFRSDKIGHLSLEYEIHLVEKKLNTNYKKNKFDIWYRDKVICNKFLYVWMLTTLTHDSNLISNKWLLL